MSKKGQRRAFLSREEELTERASAERAKTLRAKIQKASKENHRFREKRYPQKSMLQILRALRWELSPFHEAVAIAQLKRRLKELSPSDQGFILEEEQTLLQQNRQPPVQEDCPT